MILERVMWIGLLLLFILGLDGAHAFRRGDTIHMSKRSFHREFVSEWSEMMGKHNPKFGFSKSVQLHALDPNDYAADQPYKISFSVDGGRFITPWITVADGLGTYLQFIEFTFVYSGDEIIEMKWKTDYNTDEHAGQIPTSIYLHYNWQELIEKDIVSGLAVLFIAGFAIGGSVLALVVLDVDAEDRRSKKSGTRSNTPNFAYNNIPSSSFASTIRRHHASPPINSSSSSSSPSSSISPPPVPSSSPPLDPIAAEEENAGESEYSTFVGGPSEYTSGFTEFVGDSNKND